MLSNFYSIQIDGTPSDAIEQRLSEIEGLAAAALSRINPGSWPPSHEDLGVLANFVALQLTRGPDHRANMRALTEQTMRMAAKVQAHFPEAVREMLGEAGHDLTDDEFEDLLSVMKEGRFSVHRDQSQAVMESLATAAELVEPLANMHWHLLSASWPGFMTGDVPVTLWRDRKPGDIWGIGVLTSDEITLAIDRYQALRISPHKSADGSLLVASEEDVVAANFRVYQWADQYLFASLLTSRKDDSGARKP